MNVQICCFIFISLLIHNEASFPDVIQGCYQLEEAINKITNITYSVLDAFDSMFRHAPPSNGTYDTIVNIPLLGRVGGSRKPFDHDNLKTYYQYKGIKYAEPVQRFKQSVAKLPWKYVHDGTIEGKVCPQIGQWVFYSNHVDERNCLVLTVTTPQDPNKQIKKLPVLIFFYGGAYMVGTTYTSWYDPEPLVQEDIIVVQIQYRLGIFGWMTDGKLIPKNLGLKDCFLGLKWVHDNIAAFGGDPSKVTVSGESAGAMITANLWQSTKTKGMIHGAIMQSSTSLNAASFQAQPQEAFQRFLKYSVCVTTVSSSIEEQVECLKSAPAQLLGYSNALVTVASNMLTGQIFHGLDFGVVLENANDTNAMVTESPMQVLSKGDLPTSAPVLVTVTSQEMETFGPLLYIFKLLPHHSFAPAGMGIANKDDFGRLVKTHYGGSPLEFKFQPLSVYKTLGSDIAFNNGFRKFIDIVQPRKVPMYCMIFNYASSMGLFNDRKSSVGHGDDIFYTWKMNAVTAEDSFKKYFIADAAYKKRMQLNRFFANFVKTHNPTPTVDPELNNITWPLINNLTKVDCLDFSHLTTIRNPMQNNYQFWSKLFDKYSNNAFTF